MDIDNTVTGANSTDWMELYRQTAAEKAKTAHPCPNCGYCPHCGRGQQFYPMYPLYPTYPSWSNPITWTTTGTVFTK